MDQLTDATSAIYDGAAEVAAPVESDRETVVVGDELVYADTGEFAGFVVGAFLPDQLATEEDLEKFLERLMTEEARLVAEQVKRDTIIRNSQLAINRQQSRINWLRLRYEAQASALALALIPRKRDGSLKRKSWDCAYGKVAFTSSVAKLQVEDTELAAEYAQQNGYDTCVKIETKFLISELPKDAYRDMSGDAKLAEKYGFKIVPAQEVTKVTTGIKAPKDGGEADA
jgi:hypothetical protein